MVMALVYLLLLTSLTQAQVKVLSVEPASLGSDLVVVKTGEGKSEVLIGTRFMSSVLNKPVGSVALSGSDYESLQGAINLLNNSPKVCGGSIWVKEGVYDIKNKGLVLPLPSYPYHIFGNGTEKTILIYRGAGEAIGYGEALWKPGHNNVLQLSDFTLRIDGDAKYGIRILISNFSTVERVHITASAEVRPYCAISNEGPGGQTKLFRNIQITGPFEVGVFNSTDHMTLMQISVDGFRKYGLLGGWDALYSVTLTAGHGAVAGITGAPEQGAAYVRCDMAPFDINIREFYWRHVWENWGRGAIADVEDISVSQEGYATINQPVGWAVVAFKSLPKVKATEAGKKGSVVILDQSTWEKIRGQIQIPKYIDEPLVEPGVIVFKEGNVCKAQVVERKLANSLNVPAGAVIATSTVDDAEVIDSACRILPQGGRLVLEEARYHLKRPVRIPWSKELTVEGTRGWCYLIYDPKAGKEVPPPRKGTEIIADSDAFVFEGVGNGLAKFRLAHMQFGDVNGACIRLVHTSAFLKDIRLATRSWPAITVEGGKGNVFQMFTGGGEPAVDDRGEGTFFICEQHSCGTDITKKPVACLMLGKYGVVVGGHINTQAVRTQKIGPEGWAIVIGNMAEGGSENCYTADGTTLYLLSAGGSFPGIAEVSGGKVVVLGK